MTMAGNSFTITRQKVDRGERNHERSKKQIHRDKRAGTYNWSPPEFICVDGEGQGEGIDHRYVLLGVGSDQYENLDGIHWSEAFEFLYGQFEESPRAVFVGFFLSYDFNQILKTLPRDRAEMLVTQKGMNARKSQK